MEVLKWLVYSVLTVYAALPTWNLHRNLLLNWGALLRLTSAGKHATLKSLLGVIPTPAVSYLTSKLHANAGAVISASHNPFEDNGIKFFSQTGHKLPDAVEDEIEAMVAAEHDSSKNPSGSSVGRVINEEAMDKLYIDHIISTAPTKLISFISTISSAPRRPN